MVESLKRAGKDLSREKLIQTLEALYEYRTGLTPAITYGPNRRIGAMGAYVGHFDDTRWSLSRGIAIVSVRDEDDALDCGSYTSSCYDNGPVLVE